MQIQSQSIGAIDDDIDGDKTVEEIVDKYYSDFSFENDRIDKTNKIIKRIFPSVNPMNHPLPKNIVNQLKTTII